SSIQGTSSTKSSVGESSSLPSSEPSTPCSRARRNEGSRSSTSGVDSTSASSGAPSSGAHGTSFSSTVRRRSPSATRFAAPTSVSGTLRSDRKKDLKTWYGVDDSYCSHRSVTSSMSAQCIRSSSARRDCAITLAVDERKLIPGRLACPLGFRQEVTEHHCTNGIRLSLHLERFELRGCKRPASPRERLRGDPDLVLARASHQPSGKSGRVAENRVRAAKRGADLTGEDPSITDAHVHRKRQALVDGRSERPEEPLLVVSERLRRPRHEDDPAAVAVDVAFEDRYVMLVRGDLDRLHQRLERLRRRRGAFGRDDFIASREPDERDGRMPVLALEWSDLEQLRAQRPRHRNLDRSAAHIGHRHQLPKGGRGRLQQPARAF